MADTVDELQKKRRTIETKVFSCFNVITAFAPSITTMEEVDLQLQKLSGLEQELTEMMDKVSKLCDDDAYKLAIPDFRLTLDKLQQTEGKAARFKKNLQATPAPAQATSKVSEVKLPRLELPTFSGDRMEWMAFRDLFIGSVHTNANLTGAQKLQYLKKIISGEAASMIDQFDCTDNNYAKAWKLLEDRYQHIRDLAFAIIANFINHPSMKETDAKALRKVIDVSRKTVAKLTSLSITVADQDVTLIYLLLNKLDHETKRQWQLTLTNDNIPTFGSILDYLEKRSKCLEEIPGQRNTKGVNMSHQQPAQSSGKSHNTAVRTAHVAQTTNPSPSTKSCILCKQEHFLHQCPSFFGMSINERISVCTNNSVCTNCFSPRHAVAECNHRMNCRKCNKRHHTMIHTDENPSGGDQSLIGLMGINSNNQVLLGTAAIQIVDANGLRHTFRALIDNGSQASFISTRCANILRLPRHQSSLSVSGLSETKVAKVKGSVIIQLHSNSHDNFTCKLNAYILKSVTMDLPASSFQVGKWPHTTGLNLADPGYNRTGPIDVLLGADCSNYILMDGLKKGDNGPVAQQTVFGWVLSGTVTGPPRKTILSNVTTLEDTVQRFWELEEVPVIQNNNTSEEEECEAHFIATHHRLENGRYSVRLPLKPSVRHLGTSRGMAINRLKAQERSLRSNPAKYDKYRLFINEFITLGHMELIHNPTVRASDNWYYMPHHAVIKESSTTTKLRVVFDASAKTSGGLSLNDALLVGPKTQHDLFSILLRWRTHQVALIADVEKMYRQIEVDPVDRDYQRIVWRNSPEDSIQDYRLTTVTYGTASAPYAATRCLKQLAMDEAQTYPAASKVVLNDFYVDDLVSGAPTTEEGIQLARDVSSLLKTGCMNLRKWISNDFQVLAALAQDSTPEESYAIKSDTAVSTLGITWLPASDQFAYSVKLLTEDSTTKRKVLSQVASLYDPMGWLAPVVIKAKILLQEMWKLTIGWDDVLPEDVASTWKQIQQELTALEHIRIPRFALRSNPVNVQLHAFSDASEKAYSAVIYIRCSNDDGSTVSLLASKTRVAPIKTKTQSLPKLELCGALLATTLLESVKNSLPPCNNLHCFGWTDSTIVLAWLAAPPSKWVTFVANRVAKIQSGLARSNWGHVKGKENPADCASRGILPSELPSHSLWWSGPPWLQGFNAKKFNPEAEQHMTDLESKPIKAHVTQVESPFLVTRHSSWGKLLRVTAYVLRYISHFRIKKEQASQRRRGPLVVEDLRQAEICLLRWHQHQYFAAEIKALSHPMSKVNSGGRLVKLAPFIDSNGLLRVGGRLRHANLPADKKNPIILDSSGHITKLLVAHKHKELLHAGPQLMMTSLLSHYWILRVRSLTRFIYNKCVTCAKVKGETIQQMMADLPSFRVNPGHPFQYTGVDFAGPFLLRAMSGRGQKRFKAYVCLFVCFKTRALHLEVAKDLSTNNFMSALNRFIGRRGVPDEIRSDCGTNFVGTKAEIQAMQEFLQSEDHNTSVSSTLSNKGVRWILNPPSAPHFGGIWEAGVKSVKFHLKRVVGNNVLDYDEFNSLLVQIEAVLNSRPLCPVSTDPTDLTALTPGHFLIGRPLTATPEGDLLDENINRLNRWQLITHIRQQFWKRWSNEYVSRLQQRPKWVGPKPNLTVGMMVLVKDDRLPPLQWKLGRIIEVHPGCDELVRVVTVRTIQGELKRPIVKIAPLPISSTNEDIEF